MSLLQPAASPGTLALGTLALGTLALALASAAAACSGFSADQTGWWCALDYSAYPDDRSSCTVAWVCESFEGIHIGAADDPDPLLRSYPRSVDCTSIAAATGGREYSCACYEDQRHHTTFVDPTICEVYFAGQQGWFKQIVARAKDGCSWPPWPK